MGMIVCCYHQKSYMAQSRTLKKSCKSLGARAIQIENPFCSLTFYIHLNQSAAVFRFKDLFTWHHNEPLENCTGFKIMQENQIAYSQCEKRIYFACVQVEGSIKKHVAPIVSFAYANCSGFQMAWKLPPVEVVCTQNFYYFFEINSSELDWSEKLKLPQIERIYLGRDLQRNKSYSVQLTAFDLAGKPVGSPWRQNITVIASAVPDSPEITNFILEPESGKAKIFWKNFDDHGCSIMQNNIYYRIINDETNEPWERKMFVPFRSQRVQWEKLKVQLDRLYEVIVTAENSEGESSKELVNPTIGNVTKEPHIPASTKKATAILVSTPRIQTENPLQELTPTIQTENPTVQDSKSSPLTVLVTSLVVLAFIVIVTVFVIFIIKKRITTRKDACLVDQWEILPEEITCLEKIGHGQFGEVHTAEMKSRDSPRERKVRSKSQGKEKLQRPKITVAVKLLCEEADDEQKKEFLKEIQLMKKVGSHRNIVNMLGCCTSVEPMYLVVEYLANGDLLNYLRKRRNQVFESVLENRKKTNGSHYCDNLGSDAMLSQKASNKTLSSEPMLKCSQQSPGMDKDMIEMKMFS
ncbi:uncharacterized protein LOC144634385 [Oculina patagonica]